MQKLIQAALAFFLFFLTWIMHMGWLDNFELLVTAIMMAFAGILFVLALWGDKLGMGAKT